MDKKITVTKKHEGLRLDVFLSFYLSSRHQAHKYLKESLIKDHNKKVITKASYKVKKDECFFLTMIEKAPIHTLKAYNFFVPIVFEDEHVLVVNKPSGLVVHPAPGHAQDTLVNALSQSRSLYGKDLLRPGIVHRLDKDVSGLMVMAKTKLAFEHFIEQFKTRKIQRFYLSLSVSSPKNKALKIDTWQKWSSFIGRHPKNRKKFASFKTQNSGTRRATTFYKIIQSYEEGIHIVACKLATGRTHQIRLHLSELALPILGDPLYGVRTLKKAPPQLLKQVALLKRVALFATKICFLHPKTHKKLIFRLDWPQELQVLLKKLTKKSFFYNK